MNKWNKKDRKEQLSGFRCSHCNEWVSVSEYMGTTNRNHCPSCLWSKHVDLAKSGDRIAQCRAGMKPIGLTFKQEGIDKWGKLKQGELMVIHECTQGDKISINRIAGDDNPESIMEILHHSQSLNDEIRKKLDYNKIHLLTDEDEEEIKNQLYGVNL